MRHTFAVIALGTLLLASCQSSYPTGSMSSSSGSGTYTTTGTTSSTSSGTTTTAPITLGNMTSSGSTTPTQQQVEVTLNEYRIDMPDTLPTGHVVFHVVNYGSIPHSFGIRSGSTSTGYGMQGQTFDKSLPTNLDPGQSATLEVDLQAGSYAAYCPVGNHASTHGMTKTITVQ